MIISCAIDSVASLRLLDARSISAVSLLATVGCCFFVGLVFVGCGTSSFSASLACTLLGSWLNRKLPAPSIIRIWSGSRSAMKLSGSSL